MALRFGQMFTLFKGQGPRRFHYNTRYYDERKERIAKKMKLAKKLEENEKKGMYAKESMRESIRENWVRSEYSQATKSANYRVLIILIMLCIICYIIYSYMGYVDL